jgi:hypothetical protein
MPGPAGGCRPLGAALPASCMPSSRRPWAGVLRFEGRLLPPHLCCRRCCCHQHRLPHVRKTIMCRLPGRPAACTWDGAAAHGYPRVAATEARHGGTASSSSAAARLWPAATAAPAAAAAAGSAARGPSWRARQHAAASTRHANASSPPRWLCAYAARWHQAGGGAPAGPAPWWLWSADAAAGCASRAPWHGSPHDGRHASAPPAAAGAAAAAANGHASAAATAGGSGASRHDAAARHDAAWNDAARHDAARDDAAPGPAHGAWHAAAGAARHGCTPTHGHAAAGCAWPGGAAAAAGPGRRHGWHAARHGRHARHGIRSGRHGE